MYLIGDGWVGSDPCDLGMVCDWLSRILSEKSELLTQKPNKILVKYVPRTWYSTAVRTATIEQAALIG